MEKIKSESKNIGSRFLAGLIDYLIIFTLCFLYVYQVGEPNDEGGYTVTGVLALIPVLFWVLFTVGFEQFFGATLGNLLMNLKAVSLDDLENKISVSQSIKRHLLDPFDMFFFGLIAIITIKNTENNQRLGDIWANTMVIKSLK